ncbi:MAG: hypothetical protein V3V05_03800 [Pontiella sp.]
MAIHLYLDAQLTQQLSEGDFSNPDADNYNGTDGEIKDREIFVANEQTKLSSPINDTQTVIELAAPRFTDAKYIIIGAEQMQILSGGGTTSLTVRRAVSNTVAAAHANEAVVYSGYDYTGLVMDPIDEFETDESVWYKLSLTQAELDAATQSVPLNLGVKAYDQTISFWRRCTVLPNTPVQNKTDIKLRLTGTENPIL